MANEITYTVSLAYQKAGVANNIAAAAAARADVAGERYIRHVQNIGTSAEALDIGELASLGFMWVKNLDATNYVEILTGTGGVAFCKLKAGQAALLPIGSGVTAPFAQANTAAVYIEYFIIEA